MALNDRRGLLSRNAKFAFTGVIASKSPASAKKTHDALHLICSTIVDAYRVANDGTRSNSDKRHAILKVTTLKPQIEWLVNFAYQETDFCKFFPEIHPQLQKLTKDMEKEVKMLIEDFNGLAEQIEGFPDVFDNLLHLLENVTQFMKQCHAAEVCRVIEMAKNTEMECYNVLHLEVKSNFVTQVQLLTTRCKEVETGITNLVNIQEGANEDLHARLDNVLALMKVAIPAFVLASKDHLISQTPLNKETQKNTYDDLASCLEELRKICEKIKVKYVNSFEEDTTRGKAKISPLEKAAQDLMQAVAKLRALPPGLSAEEKKLYQDEIPRKTRAALQELDDCGADPEDKQSLVSCVKQARDGSLAEFYQAQEALGTLVDHVQANQIAIPSISLIMPTSTTDDDTPQSLLEAAKALCASMKSLNLTLDE